MGDLSPHFSTNEMACHCCGLCNVTTELISRLEMLRAAAGKPIHINCATRCAKHNKEVGGAPKSCHLTGLAADITIQGMSPVQVAAAADQMGFTGIGTYGTFTHVDVRKNKARWKG